MSQLSKKLPSLKVLFIIILALLPACGSGSSGGNGKNGSVTLRSTIFPEIQGIISETSANLIIAGQDCALTVDTDTTLSGQCPPIPLGGQTYALEYRHIVNTGIALSSAHGILLAASMVTIQVPVPKQTPLHPEKVLSTSGVGVSVTMVPVS